MIPDQYRPIVEGILYVGGAIAFVIYLVRVAWVKGGEK